MNRSKDESELSSFQRSVGEWGDETFYTEHISHWEFVDGRMNHLKKEIEELEKAPYIETPEELADCFLILLHLAHLRNIDLLDEARKKMKINKDRSWGEADKDGVIEHV